MLTAASALPGSAGTAARLALHAVLPAAARRSAALVLGLGLGVAAPLLAVALPVGVPAASAAAPAADVPDWPSPPATTAGAPMPDWPSGDPAAGARVVVRGDCLWHIAAEHLLARQDRPPTDAEVATAVQAWWTANADVIGPDPDLLLPGQMLRPPGPP
jgi:nucleoid-associated protein YgaU